MTDRFFKFSEIPIDEVLSRLRAGATVVTPNRRLALTLTKKFNRNNACSAKLAWKTADILPFSAFLERIYSDAFYSSQTQVASQLLSDLQERLLWESIICSSDVGYGLLQHFQTAKLAQEAWQFLHAWKISQVFASYPLGDDASTFLAWARLYEKTTCNHLQIDQARLCDWVSENYQNISIKKIASLICYGFDFFTPQQIQLLEKLQNSDCEVTVAYSISSHQFDANRHFKKIGKVGFLTSNDEIKQAAIWARTRLEENPQTSIGIVVPDLANYRSAILRIFNSVMYPDAHSLLPGADRRAVPFNLSLGLSLSSYPLIDAALICLDLLQAAVPFNRVSQLLHSPFIAGSESEKMPRALLDAKLRRFSEPTITLDRFIALIRYIDDGVSCPLLFQCLNKLAAFCKAKQLNSGSYVIYSEMITELLQLLGFPGERRLNSDEYQTYQKWQSLLIDFASLDRVKSEVCFNKAISHLKQITHDTLFQPESPSVPIQILGVLEANLITFDHLWVMGLSDEQWPLNADPNPFIPLELQTKTAFPFGSSSQAFAYSKKLTQRWLLSANEVILSYPESSNDGHVLLPSPLIHTVAKISIEQPSWKSYDERITQSCTLETIEDHQTFPLPLEILKQPVTGGTAVIKDYAACAIRALIKHRLKVKRLEIPHNGLNVMERGILMHDALAYLWKQLASKTELDTLNDVDLEEVLASSANNALSNLQSDKHTRFSPGFYEIELRRLTNVLSNWLDIERKRSGFTVAAIEQKELIQVGNLILNVRIDRIDVLENGQSIIIDYKTNRQSIQALIGDYLDEPQLPLYLVMANLHQQASGIAFAIVKAGEFGFIGILQDSDLLPDVKAYSQLTGCKHFGSWRELIATWQQQLIVLAEGFSSGDARVNPKNYPVTCQQCDMQLICRISQRLNVDSFTQSKSENDD
ncbi:probable DNA repair protein [Nitrosomonas sp. PY1]|uniref:PD-(D/E)XK nuclease family protein n=1 Tax=Nitrosomonas sp. PY1 TaxID=1803906 RepID=UPI001FC86433|nr:PD-(D/E)XK nuclease family protein [Nitrosomonas sp. PY1]GKS68315.1 probable DNA repair protein [Nitrosomonas sp. PY1]